jgi:hypothetical protein
MKKLILIITAVVTLSSCMGDGIERSKTNNDEYQVTYLFEKDGIKVYRFYDGMEHHYFTSTGETITTQGNSKNHHEENITSESISNKY